MVLWEITLATAYFLGLRRTYRLACKVERRLFRRFPSVHDKVRRRTRNVFDVVLTVHKRIQTRDIWTGKSLRNCLLRTLDRIKPSANISGSSSKEAGTTKTDLSQSAASKVGQIRKYAREANQEGVHVGHSDMMASLKPRGSSLRSIMASLKPRGSSLRSIGVAQLNRKSLPLIALEQYWKPMRRNIQACQRTSVFPSVGFRFPYAQK